MRLRHVVATALLALACAHPGAVAGASQPLAPATLAVAPVAPAEPLAFAWEVTRPGVPGKLFLTGSIHAGQPGQLVLPPSVEAAFAGSEALVVELDPAKVETQRAQELTLRLGLYAPPEGSLSSHLSPETRALLPAALDRVGLTLEQVEQMRPWFLTTMLALLELQKAGYSQDGGIDHRLLERARGSKTVVELETLDEQLGAFAAIPAPVQDTILREQLRQSPLTAISMAMATTAWQGGNPDALRKVLLERADDPSYRPVYEAIFYARNRRMAERLAPLVTKPGVHFVVVGAGHLVGDQGVPAELVRRGFEVRQLPRAAR